MSNRFSKGGRYSRGKGLYIDFHVFGDLIAKLDDLQANLHEIVGDIMEAEGEEVTVLTQEAVAKAYLPAKGDYSNGDTEKSIVKNPQVEWSGEVATIGLGFDQTMPGAGGFLITGTPKMNPDYKLEQIYSSNRFTKKMEKRISCKQ